MTNIRVLGAAAVAALIMGAGFGAKADTVQFGYCAGGPCASPIPFGTPGNGSATTGGNVMVDGTNFTVNMAATGTPPFSEPGLDTNTIALRNTGTGTGTIYLYATEMGLTTAVSSFTTGFGNNSQSDAPVFEQSYADTDAFGQTYLLGSATVNPGAAMANQTVALPAGLPSTYSVTELFGITLAAGQSLNATVSLRGQARVPEPVSLSLLGTGLVGLGLMRRRKVS